MTDVIMKENIDSIKNDIKNYIKEKKYDIELWKNVKIVTKKDGTPFVNFRNNFENANIIYDTLGYPEMKVAGSFENHYITDKIDLYEVICYMKNKKRISKTENYAPKRNCLNQIYIYDIDDIKDVIKETIEQYEKEIKSYEKQLNLADKAYIEFVTAIDNANKDLLKNCECIDDKTCLYYAIKNSVIKNI